MTQIENLVDHYVCCWLSNRSTYSGIFEDNDFGCEHLQVFRNGFRLEAFNHDELSQLATLLTRELRGQINRDHKFFWAWCAFLTNHFKNAVPLFGDRDWQGGFVDLVNLVLASRRRFPAGPVYLRYLQRALGSVNHHLLTVELSKWQIAGPLVFSILEGLLRRKNGFYVNTDGSVKRRFSINNPAGSKTYDPAGVTSQRWLNRINDSLRCFEQNVTTQRGRISPYLQPMKTEVVALYPAIADVYDTIDDWRNDVIHGKEYWQNRVPILTNLVCLLLIDEIDPVVYNGQSVIINKWIRGHSQMFTVTRSPWDIFPPDL